MQSTESYKAKPYQTIRAYAENIGKSYAILIKSNQDYKIIYFNNSFLQITDYTYDELIGASYGLLLGKQIILEDILLPITNGESVKKELRQYKKGNVPFYVDAEFIPFKNKTNEIVYILVVVQDITSLKIAEIQRRIEKKVYTAIELGHSFEEKVKMICNEMDQIYYLPLFTTVFIKGENDTLLAMVSDFFPSAVIGEKFKQHTITEIYTQAMQKTKPTLIDLHNEPTMIEEYRGYALCKGMDKCCLIPIINKKKSGIGLIAVYFQYDKGCCEEFMPLFEKLANLISLAYSYSISQRKIHQLAYTDITTGLLNRLSFINQLETEAKQGYKGFVKLLQPSEYANIVEFYGHKTGDELLRQIAERLNSNQYFQNYHFGRFSNSTLIVSSILPDHDVINYDECVQEILHTPFSVGDKDMYITLKMGVAVFDSHIGAEEAVRRADIALSYAKKQSGTHLEVFTVERSQMLERQIEILHHLTPAIHQKEFSVYFQPKVNLKNGEISSLEALVRWISPQFGFMSPADFLPVAESAGKIREIDLFVFEEVLKWIQRRHSAGKKPYRVAVNVSPSHFYHPTFVEHICHLLETYSVDPCEIIIEVTENIGLVDVRKALEIMNELNKYGIHTSVDDFGIGYSSLSYLQRLPFKELKIDRSFVNKIHEAGTEAVVKAIMQLAHTLEMDIVAEGLETEEQEKRLLELGCLIGQGYRYYKPIPMTDIDALLK